MVRGRGDGPRAALYCVHVGPRFCECIGSTKPRVGSHRRRGFYLAGLRSLRRNLQMTLRLRRLRRKHSPICGHRVRTVEVVGRRVDVDNLVGSAEIAQRTGAKNPELIHDWRRRYDDFPEPVAKLSIGLVWYWPDVEKWARSTGRL